MGPALVSQLLKSPTKDTCRAVGAGKANWVTRLTLLRFFDWNNCVFNFWFLFLLMFSEIGVRRSTEQKGHNYSSMPAPRGSFVRSPAARNPVAAAADQE